jgi:hypothetical protein
MHWNKTQAIHMQYHVMYSDEEQQLRCTVAEQLP